MNKKRPSTSHPNSQTDDTSSKEEFDIEMGDLNDEEPSNFNNKIATDDIADLFELCKTQCPLKYLSVLLYMSLG